ncbi:LysR family transcriptional regulator [Frateuria defendens]|uniref:LysR family transcriptional regulator n=1 Tax=Frateuria defendens TaxID=2219559 RepID=UPI00066FF881|nr:LysR family transcriptional regulator [Frateuria defendens]
MELHEIRYALAVFKTLNFTRAAEQSFVTTPALSRAVKKLEEELGAPLFQRDTTGVAVTDFGRLVRPHLEQVMAEMSATKLAARGFLQLDNAPVSVGVMCTIGAARFLAFLAQFRLDHPGARIHLVEGSADHLAEQLLGRKLELAVMAQPEGPDARIRRRALYRERFVVAFPPGHRFEALDEVTLTEAAGEQHLLRASCEYNGQFTDLLEARGVQLPIVFRSEREDWIQTMVAGGFGVSFVPEYSATIAGLRTRPLVDPAVEREVALGWLDGAALSPTAKAFHDAIAVWDWG